MKPIATALGICALFLVPSAALAEGYIWDGDHNYNDLWSVAVNWVPDAGHPDDSGDTATISSTTGGWPDLDEDYTSAGSDDIGALTMGGIADLDVVTYTLECTVFTVNTNADVTISGSTGKVYPTSIVINGDSTVTVWGGKIETR